MPKLSTTPVALAAVLFAAVLPAAAQQASHHFRANYAAPRNPSTRSTPPSSARATTEEFFSTPLVDHLPFSETVPTPLEHHLGHIAGAPDVLSYPEEVYSYMRALAAASPRVEVFTIGESEEGREMILVVVGSEESISGLEANKAALRALADPRITTPDAAEEIIASAKPIYWSAGAIHSPETGSPEMFMELAYRLAVGESDLIREIRDGVIYMITPIIEVDGRAKVVDLHMGKRKDPDANLPTRPSTGASTSPTTTTATTSARDSPSRAPSPKPTSTIGRPSSTTITSRRRTSTRRPGAAPTTPGWTPSSSTSGTAWPTRKCRT